MADFPPLTDEQALALWRFAKDWGRTWKSQLRDRWEWGGTNAVLQGLRNSHGPTWLHRQTLKTIELHLAMQPPARPKPVVLTGGDGPVACEASFRAGWDQAIRFATFTASMVQPSSVPATGEADMRAFRSSIIHEIEKGLGTAPDAEKAPQV
jgi:hypothetical protein